MYGSIESDATEAVPTSRRRTGLLAVVVAAAALAGAAAAVTVLPTMAPTLSSAPTLAPTLAPTTYQSDEAPPRAVVASVALVALVMGLM